MKMTKLAAALAGATIMAGPAMADLLFPSLSYRTGPFASGGIPYADGYADYFTMLNERDGGIEGAMTRVEECETAYNAEKGVECYESTKGDGALVYQPLATSITYQLIPKSAADGIPLLTMGYGRTSAKDGSVFRNVFNFPVNYWDGAVAGIDHFSDVSGGSLEGKKIALLYFNGAYGKEPIPTLEKLAERDGFELVTIPVDYPGQEQKSQWLQIRRERPDFVLFWGWGVMNQVAVQEAANINYPMDQFMGVWWSGSENDVLPAGAAADGYKSLTFHNAGSDFPVFDDLKTHVFDKGLQAGDGSNLGTVLYNRGMYAAFLAAEAARDAIKENGTKDITAAMMRDALESFSMTEERMASAGFDGFGPTFDISCENHGGSGAVAVSQWDATEGKWNLITDFKTVDTSITGPLVEADAAAYAAENGIEPGCN